MKRLFLLFMLMQMAVLSLHSADITFENLNFNIASETKKAVKVAQNPSAKGDIIIPEKVKIGDVDYTVTDIAESAFSGCSGLTSMTIPSSVTSIGNYAFNGCTSLKDLRIEDGEETLKMGYNFFNYNGGGKGLFYDCPLETLYLGRDLSYRTERDYGYSPFCYMDSLKQVTIGNSVTSIGDNLFSCTSEGFSTITIGISVSLIGVDAFPPNLRIVTSLNPTPPTIRAKTFNSKTPTSGILLVPESALTNYKYAPYWNEFQTIDAIPNSGSGGSGDQNGETIFNVKIDNYIYMTIDEEQAFTDYLPSNVTASSWESSDEEIVEVTKRGKAEAYEYGNVIVRALDSDGEALITLGVFVCPTVKIHYGTDKTYEHHVIYNSTPSLYIAAPEGYEITSVSHDGADVTETVNENEGYYTPASPITDNSVISVNLVSTKDPADINGDGVVNVIDLNMVIERMNNY